MSCFCSTLEKVVVGVVTLYILQCWLLKIGVFNLMIFFNGVEWVNIILHHMMLI